MRLYLEGADVPALHAIVFLLVARRVARGARRRASSGTRRRGGGWSRARRLPSTRRSRRATAPPPAKSDEAGPSKPAHPSTDRRGSHRPQPTTCLRSLAAHDRAAHRRGGDRRAAPARPARRRRRRRVPIAPRPIRALHVPQLVRRAARRPRHEDADRGVRSSARAHGRVLRGGAVAGAGDPRALARRRDRRSARDLSARAAPALDRHLRLSRARPIVGGPRAQPVLARGRRDLRRPGQPVSGTHVAQGARRPLRTASAHGEPAARRARVRGGDVGAQARRSARGARVGCAHVAGGAVAGARSAAGGGARRTQPAVARVVGGRCAQRPADGRANDGGRVPGARLARATRRRGPRHRGSGQGHGRDRSARASCRGHAAQAGAHRNGGRGARGRCYLVRGLRSGPAGKRRQPARAGTRILAPKRPARPESTARKRVPAAGDPPHRNGELRAHHGGHARVDHAHAALDRRRGVDHRRPARHHDVAARLVHRRTASARRALGQPAPARDRRGHDRRHGGDPAHPIANRASSTHSARVATLARAMRLPEMLNASQAAPATPAGSTRHGLLGRIPHLSNIVLAGGMLMLTFAVAAASRLPVRDPDAVVAYRSRIFIIAVGLALFPIIDVIVRAGGRVGWRKGRMWEEMKAVRRERWDRRRMLIAVSAVVSFYITYFAYRNLKSFLPVLREATFDSTLLHLDHTLLGGNDPAVLLHDVLGTGIAGQVLSYVYLMYLTFVPISVVAAVAWSRRVAAGVWYVTAVNVNWVLGLLSYYLVPSLGPVFVDPPLADQMPITQVWNLQQLLLVDRVRFVADPAGSGAIQSIAGFASLHVSVLFSAALMAHLLRVWRPLRVLLWALLTLTFLATIYFGWHYLIDDVAGLAIGGASVWIAGVATGWRGLRGPRQAERKRARPRLGRP